MIETRTGAWRSQFPRAAVPVGFVVILAVGCLAALFLRPKTLAGTPVIETAPPPMPPKLSGWRIEIDSASKEERSYSGFYALTQPALVPAAAKFSLAPEPFDAPAKVLDITEWTRLGGTLQFDEHSRIIAIAPQQAGLYRVQFLGTDAQHTLEILVLGHADVSKRGDRTFLKVNGKSIGGYLDPQQSTIRRVRENAALFQIPKLFATLTPATGALELGPNFQLSQLIAFKDYYNNEGKKIYTTERHTDVLPLKPELIVKLTKLKERLQSKGIKVTRFWITSGFRTPDYNHSIGGAVFSRHCYGDAVDLCIDEDNDKHMDDLNGDGRVDKKDGIIIGNACRELELEGAVVPGGIGVYEWDGDESVKSHVHIDCRGYISRWGQVGAGKGKKLFTWWPKAEFSDDDGE